MTRILVPVDTEDAKSPNMKFGSSPYFLLVNTENRDEDKFVKNESSKYGGDLKPIKFILNLEPQIVFTRHACENAISHMKEASITPYYVEEQPVDTLLDLYNDEKLEVMTKGTH